MTPLEVVQTMNAALNAHDVENAKRYWSDTIVHSGPGVNGKSRNGWAENWTALFRSAPDWHTEPTRYTQEDNRVVMEAVTTMTITGEIATPPSGAMRPGNGANIRTRIAVVFTVEGNLITESRGYFDTTPNWVAMGLLK